MAAPATTAALVDDVFVEVDVDAKKKALVGLIRSREVPKAIVFCNRKRDIGGVMRHLQQAGLRARDLHGDLEQVHRQLTLDQFTKGEVDFLVATDVAARGLDISDMPVVVNYDVPINADDYVHRIGRTGRAGRSGRAFTFVTTEDRKSAANIERLTQRHIPRLRLNGAEPHVEAMVDSERPRAPQRSRPSSDVGRSVEGGRASRDVRMEPRPSGTRLGRSSRPDRRSLERDRAPLPSRDLQVRGCEPEPEIPVVGLGDHVPRFLLEPIPAKLLRTRNVSEPD